jgi:antitoxin VapB
VGSLRRHGQTVILEPLAQDWAWLDQVIGPVDDDFVQGALERQDGQDRPALDDLFK